MHIAVQCGDTAGKNFTDYVDYLSTNHYAPPNSTDWVDRIRTLGNEANHDISLMDQAQASDIIRFIEMLLTFNFEFPKTTVS